MKSISNKFVRIAIFASGTGTNAKNISARFSDHSTCRVSLMLTHNPQSGIFGFAPDFNIPVILLSTSQYKSGEYLLKTLDHHDIDLIVLAGYLKKIPPELVEAYPERILNIHPSLLPAYGGKGMYGKRVHEAVLQAGESQSGITIHFVDNVYDNGEIIFQSSVPIPENCSIEALQDNIHSLEHKYYPVVIENVCKKLHSH